MSYVVKGVECQPIVDNCEGCDRTVEHDGEKYCSSYPQPARKWAKQACNFATHVKLEMGTGGKTKINPLKASKRASKRH